MKAVIMAGGLGTRLASITKDMPKPMIPIDGKPVLLHQIECLKENGIIDIIIITGHGTEQITKFFNDGSMYGVKISYIIEKYPLGTAGGLFFLKNSINETFLLLNGDIMFDVNFRRMFEWHKKMNSVATLFTHPNGHPYDSALIITDSNNRVIQWMHKEEPRTDYINRVNAGIHIFEPYIFSYINALKKLDLDRGILKTLVGENVVYAYDSPEYVKDLGTPERYERVCKDYFSGIVNGKNLSRKQKAIFLDRDGTINKHIGFLTKPNQIELLPGAAAAIRNINMSGYLAVVITNQPVIARGDCTFEELGEIQMRLERLLGEQGAYLDATFFCPHHPEKGFENERIEYKIVCQCRKPLPGMLFQAKQKFNIDLSKSYVIGDNECDVQAGLAAGCKALLINEQNSFKSLLACVNNIL